MSDFKAKMHQIRFPHTALPDPLPVFKGPTSNGEGGERGGEGKRKGRGLEGPPFRVGIGPPEGLIRHCHYMRYAYNSRPVVTQHKC